MQIPMRILRKLVVDHPFLFAIGLFLVDMAVALPFVLIFRALDLDLVPLRLIIPAVQSVLVVWVIWQLGWFARSGFNGSIKDIHLYWYPVLLAFAPVLVYGRVPITAGWMLFYMAALLFTGISEEAFARGVLLPALLSRGKWLAIFFAGALFSAGHITNIFFEDFGALEWADKFLTTFSFAVLYGAVFLHTGNILPLIVLHMIHDQSYLTSGTAGPFLTQSIDIRLHMALSVLSILYGIFIALRIELPDWARDETAPEANPTRHYSKGTSGTHR